MRSTSNGFHGGLFKNNKFKKKKKKCFAPLCVSLCLKKPGDFTVSKGHGYPLMGLKEAAIGNKLGTDWEPTGNLKGTCWEQRKNEKNPLLPPSYTHTKLKRKKNQGTLSAC